MKVVLFAVLILPIFQFKSSAQQVEVSYEFRGLHIDFTVPKFIKNGGLLVKNNFVSFEETGNSDICSALWEKRGFLSSQPKERFSFSLMKKPTQVKSLELSEIQTYISGYLGERYSGVARVDFEVKDYGGRRWLQFEVSEVNNPKNVISLLNFSPLDNDTILVVRVTSMGGDIIRNKYVQVFRESIVKLMNSIRIGNGAWKPNHK